MTVECSYSRSSLYCMYMCVLLENLTRIGRACLEWGELGAANFGLMYACARYRSIVAHQLPAPRIQATAMPIQAHGQEDRAACP